MFRRTRLRPIAQEEQNECALACIAMVCDFHGTEYTLGALRQKFSHFGRGATLRDLLNCAGQLDLAARPLRAEIEDLSKLELPCILHFDFDHFVVLVQIKRGQRYLIADPASGVKTLEEGDLSRRYTGVAVELRPTPSFGKKFDQTERPRSELFSLSDHRKSIGLFVAVNTANLSISLLAPLSIQILVDKVIPGQDYYLLTILTIVFTAVGIISVFGRYTADKFNTTQSGRLQYFTTFKYINLLLSNKAGLFLNRPLGHYVAQYNSINFLVNHVVVDVGSAITDMMFILILICVLVFMDSGISILLIATSAIVIAIRWLVANRTRALQREVVSSAAQDESYFVETLRGVFSVKANRLEPVRLLGGVDKTVTAVARKYEASLFQIRYETWIGVLKAVENALVIFLLVRQVLSGSLTIGEMYTFYMYIKLLEERLSNYIGTLANILNIRVHQQRLSDVLEPSADHDDSNNISTHIKLTGSVLIDRVGYRLGPQTPLFDELSFRFDARKLTLVSGPSGVGKSTLLKIILGVLPPKGGSVSIDGVSINSIPNRMLRNNIGVVLQEDTLFSGSILANVSSFDEASDVDRVIYCCKICEVHDEVMSLPLNYLSHIGDMGSALSSGQQQRILLARALYKNPSILVLDEATANLDAQTEEKILSNLKTLKKTIIFASHSASVALVCDAELRLATT